MVATSSHAGLSNLDVGKSDHQPVLLDTEYLARVAENQPKKERKFEVRWLAEETVNEIVTTAWQKALHRGLCPTAMDKINAIHKDLHAWDRSVLKQPQARMKMLGNVVFQKKIYDHARSI